MGKIGVFFIYFAPSVGKAWNCLKIEWILSELCNYPHVCEKFLAGANVKMWLDAVKTCS